MKPTPTHSNPTTDHRPLNGHAVVPEVGVGRLLDATAVVMGRATDLSDTITDQTTRLAARELADRAENRLPTRPGLVVRAWRRLFGRARPRLRKPTRPTSTSDRRPDHPESESGSQPNGGRELAPIPAWMQWLGVWTERTVGEAPILAPLVVSGWYTFHVGTDALNMWWPIALALTVALEGGVWKLIRLYEKTLVAGDSTVALRLGILAYVASMGALIYWHASIKAAEAAKNLSAREALTAADWRPAAVVACMSLAGVYIKARKARWQRREELRAGGRVDAQLVRFSLWSWVLSPLETPAALRYAVKHRITQPIEAMEQYRAARDARRAAKRAGSTAKKQRQADEKVQRKADRALVAADSDFNAAADRPDAQADSGEPTPTRDHAAGPTPTRPRRRWRRADSDPRPDSEPTPTPTVEESGTDPTRGPDSDPRPTPTVEPTRPEADRKPTPTRSRPAAKPTPTRPRSVDNLPTDDEVITRLRELYPNTAPNWPQVRAVALGSKGRTKRLRELYLDDLAARQSA